MQLMELLWSPSIGDDTVIELVNKVTGERIKGNWLDGRIVNYSENTIYHMDWDVNRNYLFVIMNDDN